jgi:signal peptidase I
MTDVLDAKEVETPEQASRRRRRGVLVFLRDILFILLAAIIISFVIKTFFIRSFYIPSPSMENTLMVNDRVIVSLLTPGLTPLQHGDIVVFQDPGGWLPDEPPASTSSPLDEVLSFIGLAAPADSNHLIKRVIGLPGDHVQCCNALGQMTVNGVPLKEPYITLSGGATKSDPYTFNVTVPKGDIWVMGDNRNDSEDSAYHETEHDVNPFVPLRDVTGQAILISWPFNHWTFLSNYPVVFSDVSSKSK